MTTSQSPSDADQNDNMDDDLSEYEDLSRSLFQIISREDLVDNNSQRDDESRSSSNTDNDTESHTGSLPLHHLSMSWTLSEDTSSSSGQRSSSSVDIPNSYITLISQTDTDSLLSNANSDIASDEDRSQISSIDSHRVQSFHDIMDPTPSFTLSDLNNISSSAGDSSIMTENATLNESVVSGESNSSITLKMPLIDLSHIPTSCSEIPDSQLYSINKRYTFQDYIPARKLPPGDFAHDYSRYLFVPPTQNEKFEANSPLNIWIIGGNDEARNKIVSKLDSCVPGLHCSSCLHISSKHSEGFEFLFQDNKILKVCSRKDKSPVCDDDIPDVLIIHPDMVPLHDSKWKLGVEFANLYNLPTMIIAPRLSDSLLFSTEARLPEDYLFPHYCLLQKDGDLESMNFHRQLANPHGRLIPIDIESFMRLDNHLLNNAISINCHKDKTGHSIRQPFRFLSRSSSKKYSFSTLKKRIAKSIGIAILVLSLVVFTRKALVISGLNRYDFFVKERPFMTEVNSSSVITNKAMQSAVEPQTSSLVPSSLFSSPLSPSLYRAARNQATMLAKKYRSDVLELRSSYESIMSKGRRTKMKQQPKSSPSLQMSAEMTKLFSVVPSDRINKFYLQLSQGYSNVSTFHINAQRISWKSSLQVESISASLSSEKDSSLSRYTIHLKEQDCYGSVLVYVWTDHTEYYGVAVEYGTNPLAGRVIRVVCKQITGENSDTLSLWSYEPRSFLPAKHEDFHSISSRYRPTTTTYTFVAYIVANKSILFQNYMDKVKILYKNASLWAQQLFKAIKMVYVRRSLAIGDIFKKFENYTLLPKVNQSLLSINGGGESKIMQVWKNSYLVVHHHHPSSKKDPVSRNANSLGRSSRVNRAQKGAKRLLRVAGTVNSNAKLENIQGWYQGTASYIKKKRAVSKKIKTELKKKMAKTSEKISCGMNRLAKVKKTSKSSRTWRKRNRQCCGGKYRDTCGKKRTRSCKS